MKKILCPLFIAIIFVQNLVAQVDTVPPVLVCKNLPPIHLSDICYGSLKVEELVDTVYDDSQYYELAFRKLCTGDGFPSTKELTFFEGEYLGKVELWARDSAGNTSTCETGLYIQDSGLCDFGSSFYFATKEGDGIDGVFTHIIGENCLHDSIDYQIPTNTGWGCGWCKWKTLTPGRWDSYGGGVPAAGYTYDIYPSRDNDPLNGVTTYDLVLISKHVLGIEPLDSPYKIVAADANQDGQITTYDILLLRKVILGLIPKLPHGKSWRFIPHDYAFPNPQNPFDPPVPDKLTVPRSYGSPFGSYQFIGVKIGDVNFTAIPN